MSGLQRIERQEPEMEMTPMIDVTFLLLVFFLCTIRFKTLEGKLSAYLPDDVGAGAGRVDPKERVEIRIRVVREGERRDPRTPSEPWSGEGRYELAGRELAYRVGPRVAADLDDLRERLARLHEAEPDAPVTIDPGPGTVHGDVVPVLDASIGAGFEDVSFVGERTE